MLTNMFNCNKVTLNSPLIHISMRKVRGEWMVSKGRQERRKNNVRSIRESKMMSKAELARKTGLSVQTIDRVEKGYYCRLDTKRKILMALGLDLEDRAGVFFED